MSRCGAAFGAEVVRVRRGRRAFAHPGSDGVTPKVLVREKIADAGVELLRERYEVDVDANGELAREDRRVRRDHHPLGDQADLRPDRPRRPAEGDRPGRRGRGQRGRRGRNAPRDRGRQRARVDGDLRGRARDRPAARALAQHPAGARRAEGGPLGALALRRARAGGQDARRPRLRPDRPAGRAARGRPADARRRLRPLRVQGAVSGIGRRAGGDAGRGARRRPTSSPSTCR